MASFGLPGQFWAKSRQHYYRDSLSSTKWNNKEMHVLSKMIDEGAGPSFKVHFIDHCDDPDAPIGQFTWHRGCEGVGLTKDKPIPFQKDGTYMDWWGINVMIVSNLLFNNLHNGLSHGEWHRQECNLYKSSTTLLDVQSEEGNARAWLKEGISHVILDLWMDSPDDSSLPHTPHPLGVDCEYLMPLVLRPKDL